MTESGNNLFSQIFLNNCCDWLVGDTKHYKKRFYVALSRII